MKVNLSRRKWLAMAAPAPRLTGQSWQLVIDAHCHAGLGQIMNAPYTTRNDVDVTPRHMEEAGIDRTVIFPIINPTYETANQEIAEICGRYPGKFIGFAKHDPETEQGRIAPLLRHEIGGLGLKGLKLHNPRRGAGGAVFGLGACGRILAVGATFLRLSSAAGSQLNNVR